MGVEICVEGLTKSFGHQVIWQDVSLTLPAGEVSVLLGPSGTGKSVFLKTLVGLLKPDRGAIRVAGQDITRLREHELYEVRKLFGVLFQDGALFGSMNLYDNIAFPLREHTRKPESEVRRIVLEKMDMVGLIGAEEKLPGEISGGMRKRAGLARALVLDPEIILFDEPDSGLDPVRVAYLNQLIVDLNAQIDATFLIVTHDIASARQVPDNIGLLFRRELVMFGPREELLSSDEPVVGQFLNGRMQGPIGMAEEKDAAQVEEELAQLDAGDQRGPQGGKGASGAGVTPRLLPSPGVPRPPRWQAIAAREAELSAATQPLAAAPCTPTWPKARAASEPPDPADAPEPTGGEDPAPGPAAEPQAQAPAPGPAGTGAPATRRPPDGPAAPEPVEDKAPAPDRAAGPQAEAPAPRPAAGHAAPEEPAADAPASKEAQS